MKEFKTELEKEWYILTPINVGGYIINDGISVHYKDGLGIETFDNYEGYEVRCNELGIEIEKEI